MTDFDWFQEIFCFSLAVIATGMGVLWQIGGALDIVVASPLSKCKKRPTSSCDASLFYFFTFKKVRSPCTSWSCWPSGLEPLDKPGQIGEFAAKIVQKHMSQSVLTLLWHVTIKHPGTVLFCLTDSADGAAGQTGRTVPFESIFLLLD